MRHAYLAPCLAALAACYDCDDCDDHDSSSPDSVPVFFERELNDDPASANHFGVIEPGVHFFIDGDVQDGPPDRFDGFAFTAGVPLHVDFQLFANGPADLDVCLYDPQTDENVFCFATADNPEQGGVDVTVGGLDFHLVVESFSGDASYSLEINVLPLFGRLPSSAAGASAIVGVGAPAEHATGAAQGYKKPEPVRRLVFERVLEIDLANGLIIERRRQLFPEAR